MTRIVALLPAFIQHEICMWVTTKILKGATSPVYFPDEFLIASYAIRQVCATLSTPSERERLEQMFTPRLYDRFNTELDKISSENEGESGGVGDYEDSEINWSWR
ncbi:12969_t:CDS:2, partial [Acaulospora colombiana]